MRQTPTFDISITDSVTLTCSRGGKANAAVNRLALRAEREIPGLVLVNEWLRANAEGAQEPASQQVTDALDDMAALVTEAFGALATDVVVGWSGILEPFDAASLDWRLDEQEKMGAWFQMRAGMRGPLDAAESERVAADPPVMAVSSTGCEQPPPTTT
jgi:hypothetical protein